jgi:hypothetical protein
MIRKNRKIFKARCRFGAAELTVEAAMRKKWWWRWW